MKSRISFFDKTLFRKNLTRFAPCWGLYTVILLLVQFLILGSSGDYLAMEMAGYVEVMSPFTSIYALICAELLFGDLFNPRMCNAIHALPLRRETLFGTNLLSGLAFQLVPTGLIFLIALVSLLCTGMPHAWTVAPLWFLALSLQYLFFFSAAILSAMCAGSRMALAVVYGIINYGSVMVAFLVDTLFIPMYYGIKLNDAPFRLLSPVFCIAGGQFLELEMITAPATHFAQLPQVLDYIPHIGDSFYYHFAIAAVGIGILLLALRLYRRRNLEAAGDFIAIPGLRPVFLLIYTILLSTLVHIITNGLFGLDSYLGLFVGLTVGWFTGLMLLNRTPKVFSRKNAGKYALLIFLWAAILIVASLDPFGIESWIPQPSQVSSVTLADGHYTYHQTQVTLEEPAQIQRILEIHQEALNDHWEEESDTLSAVAAIPIDTDAYDRDYPIAITFTYRLRNGRTIHRYFNIWVGGESGDYLRHVFSTPAAIFGREITPVEYAAENPTLMLHDAFDGQVVYLYDHKVTLLYEAMLRDCAEGNLCQVYGLLPDREILFWLDNNDPNTPELQISTACTHTLQCLRDLGVDVDHLKEKLGLIDPK